MRYFIDSTPGKDVIGDEELMFRFTNEYMEMIYPLENSSYLIINIIPRSNSSVFVATCLDDFDEILSNFDNEDYVEVVADTWPLFFSLLINGQKDKYSEGALIKLEDMDCGDPKWFLSSVAGNISFDDMESLLASEQLMTAVSVVINKTVELYNEINTKEPSAIKQFSKGVLKGLAGVAALALLGLGGDS